MQSTPGSFRRGPPSGSFSRKVSGAGSRLASLTNRRRTSSVISVASSVGGSAATGGGCRKSSVSEYFGIGQNGKARIRAVETWADQSMDAEAIMGRVLRTPRDLPTLYAQHAQDPLGPLGGFNQEASAVKGIEEMVRNAQLRKYDRGLRARNLAMVVTAVLGLAAMIALQQAPIPLTEPHLVGADAWEFACSGLTVVLLLQLVELRVWTARRHPTKAWDSEPGRYAATRSRLRALVEVVVLGFHPAPFAGLRDAGVLMFLRLYLLARVLRDFSKLYRARGKLAKSGTRAVPIRHFGWRLAAKAWFYEAPATSVSVVSLLMMVVLAYCLVVVEAPHADEPRAVRGPDDAVWLLIVAMTTLGYGDRVPHSTAGQVLTILAVAQGVILSAILISFVHSQLALSYQQAFAAKILEKDRLRERETVASARYISATWRHVRERRRHAGLVEDERRASQLLPRPPPPSALKGGGGSCRSSAEEAEEAMQSDHAAAAAAAAAAHARGEGAGGGSKSAPGIRREGRRSSIPGIVTGLIGGGGTSTTPDQPASPSSAPSGSVPPARRGRRSSIPGIVTGGMGGPSPAGPAQRAAAERTKSEKLVRANRETMAATLKEWRLIRDKRLAVEQNVVDPSMQLLFGVR